jgi:hypothetical protein
MGTKRVPTESTDLKTFTPQSRHRKGIKKASRRPQDCTDLHCACEVCRLGKVLDMPLESPLSAW